MLPAALLVARLVVGVVFVASSVTKMRRFADLTQDVLDYQLLPLEYARVVAIAFPAVEFAAALLCLAGIWLPVGSAIAMGLLVIFTAAVAINVRRGRRFACHCFGGSSTKVGPAVIVRNVILFVIATFVTFQSLPLLDVSPGLKQWEADLVTLSHLPTLLPLIASCLLLLSILLLLGEMDVVIGDVVAGKG